MTRILKDWIEGFIEFTEDTEPPYMFRKWTAVSVVAACLQRKCALDLGHIVVYPNLFIVLVGPPGSRKGTAMTCGFSFLGRLGIKVAAEATTKEALVKEIVAANAVATDPDNPGRMDMHSSLSIYSEELTVFLGYNNGDLMSYLSNWYDCKDKWEYKTKTQGKDYISGVWVNLLGATTPELLRGSLPKDTIGSGLASRIIFVFEDKKGKCIPMVNLRVDRELEKKLFTDLEKISMMSGKFRYTPEFNDRFIEWYIYQDTRPPFDDVNFVGYCQRRAIHLVKTSMVISASRSSDKVITREDFETALNLLEQTEVRMQETFSGVGFSDIASITARVLKYIEDRGEVKLSEVMTTFYKDADILTMQRVLATLEAMGSCRGEIVAGSTEKYIYFKGRKQLK
jgi:hypothetical protein